MHPSSIDVRRWEQDSSGRWNKIGHRTTTHIINKTKHIYLPSGKPTRLSIQLISTINSIINSKINNRRHQKNEVLTPAAAIILSISNKQWLSIFNGVTRYWVKTESYSTIRQKKIVVTRMGIGGLRSVVPDYENWMVRIHYISFRITFLFLFDVVVVVIVYLVFSLAFGLVYTIFLRKRNRERERERQLMVEQIG